MFPDTAKPITSSRRSTTKTSKEHISHGRYGVGQFHVPTHHTPFYNKTYRVKDGQMIADAFLHAFVNNGHYYLTEVKIYKDGLIDIGDFRPIDLDGFKEKVRQGRLVPTPPKNARIGMGVSTLFFTAVDVKSNVPPEEFIKEVEDELRHMNKQPTSADICRANLQGSTNRRKQRGFAYRL